MVRHVIMWNMKDGLSPDESRKAKTDIRDALEALKGVVPGLLEVNVVTDPLETSNADLPWKKYDLSGKTIILFATSGSSGFGKTAENIKASVAEDTVVKEGKVFTEKPGKAELEELAGM